MYKILSANGVEFTDPEGSFTLSKSDVVNEYEAENGHKTVEIVRSGKVSASASYTGLPVAQVKTIAETLKPVTTFRIYDALSDTRKDITARVTNVKVQKVFHKNDLSVWGLSFDLEEL